MTKKPYHVDVPREQFFRYQEGEFAQTAFPDMDAADREFLISATSPEGWTQLFGPAPTRRRKR